MATPLGTSFTDEEVVAQSDVNLIGTKVETLTVEFDQAKYEELLSSGSLSPKAMRKIRKVSREVKASGRPESPRGNAAVETNGSSSVSSKGKRPASTEPAEQVEESIPVPTQRISGHKRPIAASNLANESVDAAKALRQAKKNAARRRRRSIRRAQLREDRSSRQRDSELRIPANERPPRVENGPQWRVIKTKREPQGRVPPIKREPQGRVPKTKREPQGCVPETKREPQGRVPPIKRGLHVHVLSTKRDPRVRVQQTKRNPQGRVSTSKRRLQVSVSQTEYDPRVCAAKCDEIRRVQKDEPGFKIHVNPEPTQSDDEGPVSDKTTDPMVDVPQVSDLGELLSRERSTQQVAHACPCERLIATVLSKCRCCAPAPRRSIFRRLTNPTPPKRRRQSHGRKAPKVEYPEVTVNMVGRGTSLAPSSDDSETNCPPSVKEISDKFEGIYQRTRTRQGVIPPVNYQRLARGLEPEEEHSAIADSQSSSSFVEHESAVYTTENTEDFKKRLEEHQAVMQEALRSQQESINQLRDMVAQLIADRAQDHMFGSTPQPESSRRRSRSSKRKEKVNEASDQEAHHIESSSEEKKRTENEQDPQSAKMRELEARLNAMANRCELQDQGVVRPYPAEWDTVPYPPKFKIPTLQAFDGTGSPNQHIYHFKSQTGNAMSNDAILARLFIGTLKGVAFEWFMKLPAGCIQKWADLERLFLSRFFEDDMEVSVTSLLATKQKEGEPIKAFVERFRSMALRCSTGMTQSALIDTCRHNLRTSLLARMGVAKCRSWKQLVSQGEQAEAIIARVEAEEKEADSEDLAIDGPALNREADSEDLAINDPAPNREADAEDSFCIYPE